MRTTNNLSSGHSLHDALIEDEPLLFPARYSVRAAVIQLVLMIHCHPYTSFLPVEHAFVTLMKRVDGSGKDKLELIGHAHEEQLRYYQDVALDDLRKITDAI